MRELIPFYSQMGWALTSQRKRENVYMCYLISVAHAVETVVGAHNTVYVQMQVAGSTVFV